MTQKPFSYSSEQAILKYMGVSLRSQLSSRCKALCTANASTPLRVSKIDFSSSNEVVIDDTCYRLGIYRKFDSGYRIPEYEISAANFRGGAQYDLDRFGFADHRPEATATTPGDIFIKPDPPFRIVDDWDLERWKRDDVARKIQLSKFQWKQGKVTERKHLQKVFDLEYSLIFYNCRRDNVDAPYRAYFQLTTNKVGTKKKMIERVECRGWLRDASKYFLSKMFKTDCAMQVGRLVVTDGPMTLRLPEGLKMHVYHFHCIKQITHLCNVMQPILANSCFHFLEAYVQDSTVLAEDLKHPMVQSSQKLSISINSMQGNWWPMLLSLRIPKIRIKCSLYWFPKQKLLDLIDNWMKRQPDIGVIFVLDTPGEGELFKEIERAYAVSGKRKTDIILPINANSCLEISRCCFLEEEGETPKRWWRVKMKVVENKKEVQLELGNLKI